MRSTMRTNYFCIWHSLLCVYNSNKWYMMHQVHGFLSIQDLMFILLVRKVNMMSSLDNLGNNFGGKLYVLDGKNLDRWARKWRWSLSSKMWRIYCKHIFKTLIMMYYRFKLLLIKNWRIKISMWCFTFINMLILSISRKLRIQLEWRKKAHLQILRRQFKLLHMENNEKVAKYFNGIMKVVNLIESSGEVISDHTIMKKVMCTLSSMFGYITVAI